MHRPMWLLSSLEATVLTLESHLAFDIILIFFYTGPALWDYLCDFENAPAYQAFWDNRPAKSVDTPPIQVHMHNQRAHNFIWAWIYQDKRNNTIHHPSSWEAPTLRCCHQKLVWLVQRNFGILRVLLLQTGHCIHLVLINPNFSNPILNAFFWNSCCKPLSI